MPTAGDVAAHFGAAPEMATALNAACDEYGIDTPLAVCHFIAQLAVESANFHRNVECLDYSVDGLLKTFSRERISADQCELFGHSDAHPARQQDIANCVYGGTWGRINLGNRLATDGWTFRGRGPAQITGRDNYTACAVSTGMLLTTNPDLLLVAANGARSAAWFWAFKECAPAAARDNVVAVTRKWNGGISAVDRRAAALGTAKQLMGIA